MYLLQIKMPSVATFSTQPLNKTWSVKATHLEIVC